MEVVYKANSLKARINQIKQEKKQIAFVPTMGALHSGHLSLVEVAESSNSFVVVSIFVNPTQFNDKKDLEKYPRTLERDLQLLSEQGYCDLVFVPESPEEVYTETYRAVKVDLGGLDKVMEGASRAGHFEGVVNVVNQLFSLVEPNKACFGEKDFQQLAIIRRMTRELNLDIDIIGCPISREASGLARSSRNERLPADVRLRAAIVYRALIKLKDNYLRYSLSTCVRIAVNEINTEQGFKVEYLSIVDGNNLNPIKAWHESSYPVACIAVQVGEIRLIDNCTILD